MANPNWKKGISGNPNGRPRRGDTFAELLQKELKKRRYTIRDESGEHKVNGKVAIIKAHLAIIFSKTASEEVRLRAIDSLYNRCDGRPDVYKHIFHEDLPEVVILHPGEEVPDADDGA